jgi:hypothetical protein
MGKKKVAGSKVQNLTYFLPNNLSETFHIYYLQLCAQS